MHMHHYRCKLAASALTSSPTTPFSVSAAPPGTLLASLALAFFVGVFVLPVGGCAWLSCDACASLGP
eukprot:3359451-Rhodomonas_salina.1